jgi:hypothetical protein
MVQIDQQDALAKLVCGQVPQGSSTLSQTLGHLSTTLTSLVRELPEPFGTRSEARPLFVPVLVRGILEVTCTALIARTDPFRILALREIQRSPSYTPDRRVACAIQWQGDIVTDKASAWDPEMKPEKLARALLGDHQDQVLWRPAFELFLDALNERGALGRWSQELQGMAPESFIPWVRGQAQRIYTAASKGIHHESLLPFSAYNDESSIPVMIETLMKTVAALSVVANFCEHLSFPVPPDDALAIHEALQ